MRIIVQAMDNKSRKQESSRAARDRMSMRTSVRKHVAEDSDNEMLDYMRGRDTDYLIADTPDDPDSVPLENLYGSSGNGDLDREGDTVESMRDRAYLNRTEKKRPQR
jgi:hypothetical protein